MLLAIDLHIDFIDEESVSEATVFSFQAAGINGSELDAPKADCFAADSDASFSQEIFNISVTEVESVVEPDGVGNDIWWESVTFVCVHPRILSISASLLGDTATGPRCCFNNNVV